MSELGSALGTRDGKLLGEAGMMTKEKLMLLIASVPCFGEEHAAACPDRIMGSCGHAVRMDHCAIGRMADWLLANGVTFATDNNAGGKWIPVTERLPEDGEFCICFDGRIADVLRWDERKCRWCHYLRAYPKTSVICWMPLPEPPREGE